ncbi:hypothetical protein SLA2020_192460 [Shorea laevis]
MHRRCGASKVVDLVDLQKKRFDDVVADELEIGVPKVVHQVFLPPGEEIIHHDHAVASCNQTVDEVGTDESSAIGDNDPQSLPLQPQRDLPRRVR